MKETADWAVYQKLSIATALEAIILAVIKIKVFACCFSHASDNNTNWNFDLNGNLYTLQPANALQEIISYIFGYLLI